MASKTIVDKMTSLSTRVY